VVLLAEYVTTEACARTRESFSKEFGNIGSELCSHDEDLTDIKIAITKLTLIQEVLHDNQKTVIQFWQSETGKRLIWGVFMLVAVITFVALGKDLDIVSAFFGK